MTLGGIAEIQVEEGVVKTKYCRSLVTVKAVSDKGGIHTLTRDLRQAGRLHPLIFLSSQAMLRPKLHMVANKPKKLFKPLALCSGTGSRAS